MTNTKEEFKESFNREKYLADTTELAAAMVHLVSGYSIAQALTSLEAAVFFVSNIEGDKEICTTRINIFCGNLKKIYLKELDKEKENVD
jgi:hypothetical protein